MPHRPARPRLAAIALAAAVACSLAACGSDDTDNNKDPGDTSVDTAPKPTTGESGPLDSFETDTSSDSSDGTVLGDPMQPSTNDSTVTNSGP